MQIATSRPQRAPPAPPPLWEPQAPSPERVGGGVVKPACPILLLLVTLIPLLGVLKVMFSVRGNILHDTSEAEALFRGI